MYRKMWILAAIAMASMTFPVRSASAASIAARDSRPVSYPADARLLPAAAHGDDALGYLRAEFSGEASSRLARPATWSGDLKVKAHARSSDVKSLCASADDQDNPNARWKALAFDSAGSRRLTIDSQSAALLQRGLPDVNSAANHPALEDGQSASPRIDDYSVNLPTLASTELDAAFFVGNPQGAPRTQSSADMDAPPSVTSMSVAIPEARWTGLVVLLGGAAATTMQRRKRRTCKATS
jgi:hypothetical protein